MSCSTSTRTERRDKALDELEVQLAPPDALVLLAIAGRVCVSEAVLSGYLSQNGDALRRHQRHEHLLSIIDVPDCLAPELHAFPTLFSESSGTCKRWRCRAHDVGLTRGEPQTDPSRAFFCLKALGFKESLCQDRSPSAQEPQIRYLLLSDIRRLLRLLESQRAGLWLGSLVPPR
jgi:hypothetical protein